MTQSISIPLASLDLLKICLRILSGIGRIIIIIIIIIIIVKLKRQSNFKNRPV